MVSNYQVITNNFAPCGKQESSKSSIPQIVFQAIVASFCPRKPAFLRHFLRGIMAKIYTALNKEKADEESKESLSTLICSKR